MYWHEPSKASTEMRTLPKLKKLYLKDIKLTEEYFLRLLSGADQLEGIKLRRVTVTTVNGIKPEIRHSTFTKLKNIVIYDCKLNLETFTTLLMFAPDLREINLSYISLDRRGELKPIFPKLEYLILSNISKEIIDPLLIMKSAISLKRMCLQGISFDEYTLEQVRGVNFSQVVSLNLTDCRSHITVLQNIVNNASLLSCVSIYSCKINNPNKQFITLPTACELSEQNNTGFYSSASTETDLARVPEFHVATLSSDSRFICDANVKYDNDEYNIERIFIGKPKNQSLI